MNLIELHNRPHSAIRKERRKLRRITVSRPVDGDEMALAVHRHIAAQGQVEIAMYRICPGQRRTENRHQLVLTAHGSRTLGHRGRRFLGRDRRGGSHQRVLAAIIGWLRRNRRHRLGFRRGCHGRRRGDFNHARHFDDPGHFHLDDPRDFHHTRRGRGHGMDGGAHS